MAAVAALGIAAGGVYEPLRIDSATSFRLSSLLEQTLLDAAALSRGFRGVPIKAVGEMARRIVTAGTYWKSMLLVRGIGAFLRETTEVDARHVGSLNNDLADYFVAVNANVCEIDVGFVDSPNMMFNSLAANREFGMAAVTGCAAAIANAVLHATGRRLREMPFRIEHLLWRWVAKRRSRRGRDRDRPFGVASKEVVSEVAV